MSIKGIIYYNSKWENGVTQLKQIVTNYEHMGILATKCHYKRHNSWAEFENGDTWRVLYANDSARGYKYNIAYIERTIDYNIYRCIIAPKMLDFPYSGYKLWGEGNLHLDFDPPLPF